MIRVLVTGGRLFGDVTRARNRLTEQFANRSVTDLRLLQLATYQRWFVLDTLTSHHKNKEAFSVLIHGGANGVDACAKDWAQLNKIPQIEIFVDATSWERSRFAGMAKEESHG